MNSVTDYAGLITSPFFLSQLAQAIGMTKSQQLEAGFLCWTDGDKVVVNMAATDKETSIARHRQQAEWARMWPENTGMYEGFRCQVIAHVHIHLGAGKNEFHPRIDECIASGSDIYFLLTLREENRRIAEEFGDPIVNPVFIVGDKAGELFLCQFDADSPLVSDDDLDNALADNLNLLFERWHHRQLKVSWDWGQVFLLRRRGISSLRPLQNSLSAAIARFRLRLCPSSSAYIPHIRLPRPSSARTKPRDFATKWSFVMVSLPPFVLCPQRRMLELYSALGIRWKRIPGIDRIHYHEVSSLFYFQTEESEEVEADDNEDDDFDDWWVDADR